MGADLEVAHSAGLISTGIPSATVSMPSIGNRRFQKLFMAGKNETAKPSQPKNKQLARAILPSKKSEIITKGHVRNPISKPLPMRVIRSPSRKGTPKNTVSHPATLLTKKTIRNPMSRALFSIPRKEYPEPPATVVATELRRTSVESKKRKAEIYCIDSNVRVFSTLIKVLSSSSELENLTYLSSELLVVQRQSIALR